MHHIDADGLPMFQIKIRFGFDYLPLLLIGGDVPIDWRYAMAA